MSVVTGLDAGDLEEIGTALKRHCSTGRHVKKYIVAIQGDHRDKIAAWFAAQGRKGHTRRRLMRRARQMHLVGRHETDRAAEARGMQADAPTVRAFEIADRFARGDDPAKAMRRSCTPGVTRTPKI